MATGLNKLRGNPALNDKTDRNVKRAAHDAERIIITFKETALQAAAAEVANSGRAKAKAQAKNALPEAVLAPLEYLARNIGAHSIEPLFAKRPPSGSASRSRLERQARALASSITEPTLPALRGVTVCKVDAKALTDRHLKHLATASAIASVERMPMRWLAATRQTRTTGVDPLRNSQWGLRAIGWFEAIIPNASEVEVALLDTGIDLKHPDLAAQVADYSHAGRRAEDFLGHGTHVGGIIAATCNNKIGISGVSNCRLRVWKIFPDKPAQDGEFYVDGEAYLSALGQAAEAERVRVVNLSIGGTAHSQIEQSLFNLLTEKGKVVVAAMGNEFEDGNPVEYPAAYNRVVGVGAIDITLRRARFSNTGKHISLVAPGQDILSTLPMKRSRYLDESEYAHWNGTSMATPFVAGAVALLCAKRRSLTSEAVLGRLQRTATRLPSMGRTEFNPEYGHGLLSLPRLLK